MKELNSQEWIARLLELERPGTGNVLVYYEHRMGGFCRDPRLMLVPLDDHLVHRGDGVFEAMRMAGRRILQLDAHLDRLKDSAAALGLKPPCSWQEIRGILIDCAKAADVSEGGLKLLLGRGGGGLGVDPRESPQSSLYIVGTASRALPESYWERGLTACRSAIPAKQGYLARIKSTNYLPNALMAVEATQRGVDVSFAFDEEGYLAEAAVANVGVVTADGRLLFPEIRNVLPGTTAILAMDVAREVMPVELTNIGEEVLFEAKEILIFGTTPECVGVVSYEGRPLGDGRPGPIARKLKDLIHEALITGGTPY